MSFKSLHQGGLGFGRHRVDFALPRRAAEQVSLVEDDGFGRDDLGRLKRVRPGRDVDQDLLWFELDPVTDAVVYGEGNALPIDEQEVVVSNCLAGGA